MGTRLTTTHDPGKSSRVPGYYPTTYSTSFEAQGLLPETYPKPESYPTINQAIDLSHVIKLEWAPVTYPRGWWTRVAIPASSSLQYLRIPMRFFGNFLGIIF
jgi:hypothetical protein